MSSSKFFRVTSLFLAAITCLSVASTDAQMISKGQIARNFTVFDHETGEPVELQDFLGQIVLLDFFAYWCGPCRVSAPDVERNINQYYQGLKGNPFGIPVKVISVNIDFRDDAATEDYIEETGIDFVVDDFNDSAYGQFSVGAIPLFVLINGQPNSTTHELWEVLESDAGY